MKAKPTGREKTRPNRQESRAVLRLITLHCGWSSLQSDQIQHSAPADWRRTEQGSFSLLRTYLLRLGFPGVVNKPASQLLGIPDRGKHRTEQSGLQPEYAPTINFHQSSKAILMTAQVFSL